jgi:hypothetical protein
MIRLNDEFVPPTLERTVVEQTAAIPELLRAFEMGSRDEKERALLELIILGAEHELTDCLASPDPLTAELATAGVWECWLNEEGPEAREKIDSGILLLEDGNLLMAEKVFRDLSRQFPGWAEPINKQATVLYRANRAERSMDLCELVVEMKPRHFGAWHGMALCAVRLHDWDTAISAAREALHIQPQAKANREIIILARSKLKFRQS